MFTAGWHGNDKPPRAKIEDLRACGKWMVEVAGDFYKSFSPTKRKSYP